MLENSKALNMDLDKMGTRKHCVKTFKKSPRNQKNQRL